MNERRWIVTYVVWFYDHELDGRLQLKQSIRQSHPVEAPSGYKAMLRIKELFQESVVLSARAV